MSDIEVSAGQTSSGLVIERGDLFVVDGGGTIVHTTLAVGAGGSLAFSSHAAAVAVGTTISAMALLTVSGGDLSGSRVLSGGSEVLRGGSTDIGARIAGSFVAIGAGNVVSAASVLAGGTLGVEAGDRVISAVVGGSLTLGDLTLGGASATGAAGSFVTVLGGGLEAVGPGASDRSASVLSGGLQEISGGSVLGAVIGPGGSQVIDGGNARGTVVQAAGRVIVQAGSVAQITVQSGGVAVFYPGAAATGAVLAGGLAVEMGRMGSGLVVRPGATVISTGVVLLSDSGVSAAASVSGGAVRDGQLQMVLAGGTATRVHVAAHGLQRIESGGIASGTVLAGTMRVAGGLAVLEVDGGSVIGTQVRAAGLLHLDGGMAAAVQETAGGVIDATGGAVVSGAMLQGDTARGYAATAVFDGGAAMLGGTIGNDGVVSIERSGSAGGVALGSGGLLEVFDGGVASGVVVGGGGTLFDDGNAAAGYHGTIVGAVIESGGVLSLGDPDDASATRLEIGGSIALASFPAGQKISVTLRGTDTLMVSGFHVHATITLAGNYTGAVFAVSGDVVTLASDPQPSGRMAADVRSAGHHATARDLLVPKGEIGRDGADSVQAPLRVGGGGPSVLHDAWGGVPPHLFGR